METSRLIEELAASVRLAAGTATVLLLVSKDGRPIEEACAPLLALLRAAGPFRIEDLGRADARLGPKAWADRTPSRSADAFVLALEPGAPLAVRSFGRRLNGEREHLRRLGGPLLILMNADDERELRHIAPDFFTWVANTHELPTVSELSAHARQTLGPPVATAPVASAAPTARPVRFLHLSDIHFKTGAARVYDRSKVLQGLLERLRKDRDKLPLDLIFFTGDLANTAAEDEYKAAVTFLDDLLATTGVEKNHLFIVPGNHDVDRKVGRWSLRTLVSDGDATDFFVEPENRQVHDRKFAAYREALTGLLGDRRPLGLRVGGEAVEVIEVRGVKLAVASFNSAWFAVADDDIEKLWLGEANVDSAAQRIEREQGVSVAVALMHHPTEYLSDVERSAVEKYLERSFDLVLRGHLHRDKAKSVSTGRGGYVELAAPAAYQGSQWPNGCFVGEIHAVPKALRVRAYKFGSGADPWTPDPSVFPDDEDGSHTFALRERRRTAAISRGIDIGGMESLILGDLAGADRAITIGPVKVQDIVGSDLLGALEGRGGRISAYLQERLVKGLVAQIPPPPDPPAPWGQAAFVASLRRLADYWQERGDEWLEAFGSNETAYLIFAHAFFERQSGEPIITEAPQHGVIHDLLIGSKGNQAVVEIRAGGQDSAQRALQRLQQHLMSSAQFGAVLWFRSDRPGEETGEIRQIEGTALWLVSL